MSPKPVKSLALAFLALTTGAQAATYSVGTDPACTHTTVQAALDAAAANPTGTQQVKLLTGELAVANLAINAPQSAISIEGGYTSCSAASATGTTTLRKAASPANARIFEFSNTITAGTPRRTIRLARLTLTGARHTGALGGGALYVAGALDVHLDQRMRIHDNHAASGGGIYLLSLGNADYRTRLVVNGGSSAAERAEITGNHATGSGTSGNGGGIYAIGSAEIVLEAARIASNQARRNGGGLAFDAGANGELMFKHPASTLATEISQNTAGTGGFSTTIGLGGGLFVERVRITSTASFAAPLIAISENQANHGGGMYYLGATDNQPRAAFLNSQWNGNVALGKGGAIRSHDAVNLRITHEEVGGYCLVIFIPVRCSQIRNNIARNQGTPHDAGGGAIYATMQTGPTFSQVGDVYIQRTLIENNDDENGRAAVGYFGNGTWLWMEGSILRNNIAGVANGVLLWMEGMHSPNVRYTTILGNEVDYLFQVSTGALFLTGSILWDPGTPLAILGPSTQMYHHDCLISHTRDQLAAPNSAVQTLDPLLDSAFRPRRGRSPAIDVCNDGYFAPGADLNMRARNRDVPGVASLTGHFDLGAVEQTDILFYGGFGTRPGN